MICMSSESLCTFNKDQLFIENADEYKAIQDLLIIYVLFSLQIISNAECITKNDELGLRKSFCRLQCSKHAYAEHRSITRNNNNFLKSVSINNCSAASSTSSSSSSSSSAAAETSKEQSSTTATTNSLSTTQHSSEANDKQNINCNKKETCLSEKEPFERENFQLILDKINIKHNNSNRQIRTVQFNPSLNSNNIYTRKHEKLCSISNSFILNNVTNTRYSVANKKYKPILSKQKQPYITHICSQPIHEKQYSSENNNSSLLNTILKQNNPSIHINEIKSKQLRAVLNMNTSEPQQNVCSETLIPQVESFKDSPLMSMLTTTTNKKNSDISQLHENLMQSVFKHNIQREEDDNKTSSLIKSPDPSTLPALRKLCWN